MKNKKEVSQTKKRNLFIILTRRKSKAEFEKVKEQILEEEEEKLDKKIKKIEKDYLDREKELKEIGKILDEEVELTEEEKENLGVRIKGLKKEKSLEEQKRDIIKQAQIETKKRIQRERRKIIEKNANSAKFKVAIASLSGAIAIGGIGVGAGGMYALTEAKNKLKTEITLDASKYPDGINIENVKSDRQVLLDGLDAREYVQQTEREKIKEKVKEEVNNLKTGRDILNYLKGFYVDEYNESTNSNITKDNVRLYVEFRQSEASMYELYNDFAENGDKIIRKTRIKEEVEGFHTDVIMATIMDDDNNYVTSETISYESGICTEVYESDQYVESYKDGILVDVGNIMRQGLCYYSEITNENKKDRESDRSIQAMSEYKHDLIEAVTEYEQTNKQCFNQKEEERE